MLVFAGGTWQDITLPFSDPLLTEGHKRWAAAVVARELKRGKSLRDATDIAEAALYERMYGVGQLPPRQQSSKGPAGTA